MILITLIYVRPYLNKKIIPKAIFTAPKKIHRKIIASNANYLFESIKNINQDKIIEYIPLETSGAQIREFPHGKAGILFFEKGTN